MVFRIHAPVLSVHGVLWSGVQGPPITKKNRDIFVIDGNKKSINLLMRMIFRSSQDHTFFSLFLFVHSLVLDHYIF
jgi:hypothetical protein